MSTNLSYKVISCSTTYGIYLNKTSKPNHCLFRFTEEALHRPPHILYKQSMTSSCTFKGLQSITIMLSLYCLLKMSFCNHLCCSAVFLEPMFSIHTACTFMWLLLAFIFQSTFFTYRTLYFSKPRTLYFSTC